VSANTFTTKKRRFSFSKLNCGREYRPVNPHHRGRLPFPDRLFFPHFRQHKPRLLKPIGTVGVEEHRRPDAVFSDRALNARKRDLQTFRVGTERQKQSELLRTSF
jgi:hypothetical protein